MDSNRIIDLTVKELTGSITPEEKEELNALISKNEKNQKVYSETIRKWDQAARFSLAAEGDTEVSWQSFTQKKDQAKAKVFMLSPFYKVAAAIIVVIGLGVVLFNPWGTVEYETGVGETLEVILADHTFVTLNESSRLVLSDNYNEGERLVEFSGEAYFDVAEDPSRPFVIQSGVSEIRVLGTSFNVDANDKNESVEVDVTSGRVQLSEIGNMANLVVLTRGMKGTFESVNRQITSGEYQNQNFQSWRTRTLEFDDISMQEVLEDMEEYFGEEVSVTDEAILSCKFTSTFSEPEIGEVLEVVSLTLDLSVEEPGEAYILSGQGCAENQK